MTILVVEDDGIISFLLTTLLEKNGYPVAVAANGFEALTYLQQHVELPRLILLDLSMPVMTGWEFREEQQRDPTLAHIPVVIMSALPDLQEKVLGLRVHDYLEKPIPIPLLLSTVARYYRQEAGSALSG